MRSNDDYLPNNKIIWNYLSHLGLYDTRHIIGREGVDVRAETFNVLAPCSVG